MPQPTLNQVHVDAILTNISVAYIQSTAQFIAPRVFPIIPVAKKSDLYFKYTKNDWFRDEAQRRAPNTESAGSGYGLTTDSYDCDVFAFHKDVDNQTLANADAPLNLEREATTFVTQRLMLRLEKQWADDYFTTSVWGQDYTGVAASPGANQFVQWNDYTASDPFGDFETGKRHILSTTGFMPNTLVLGYDVFMKLKNNPDFIDRIKYTSSNVVTPDLLARLLEIDRVLVAQSIIATNNEGATEAYSFVHGKGALLCYVAPNPGLLTPSAGYVFSWNGISQGLGSTVAVSSFPMLNLKSQRYEGEMAFDDKVVASDLGVYFDQAVA